MMRGLRSPPMLSKPFGHSSMLNLRSSTFLGFLAGLLVSTLFQLGKVPSNPLSRISQQTPKTFSTSPAPHEPFTNPGFTIVTPSFKREHLLPEFLSFYAKGNIESLKAIVIQWVDPDSAPSPTFTETLSDFNVPIFIVRTVDKSLNERFRWPIDNSMVLASNAKATDRSVSTTDVVLALDDDLEFGAKDVEAGFQAFREYASYDQMRMVGFFAREITDAGTYDHHPRPRYNLVLTKGAFLHRDWLEAYWADDLAEVRDYVTKGRNCEDILMSYLVATITSPPPLLFHAPGVDASGKQGNHGISMSANHKSARNKCVQRFKEHFGGNVLKDMTTQMKRHHTGENLL